MEGSVQLNPSRLFNFEHLTDVLRGLIDGQKKLNEKLVEIRKGQGG
jgi:hypothetical protein